MSEPRYLPGYPPLGSDPNNLFVILPTDRVFTDSPDAGWPECICSRCGKMIPENDPPVRAWTEDGKLEWRYHPGCLGFQTFSDEGMDDL